MTARKIRTALVIRDAIENKDSQTVCCRYEHNGRNKAMEMMASFGYSRDSDVEKHWRDSKIMQLCSVERSWDA